MTRIGMGFDVHRFARERKLILGGVEIPFESGLLGHSDADVLLHAICDALLGAAAMGDIGKHFPDTDPAFKGISSRNLLANVVALLRSKGYAVGNIDTTVVMERPKIAPYVDQMRTTIAEILGVSIHAVSVKATTNEGMGFIGVGEGAVAYAVATINEIKIS